LPGSAGFMAAYQEALDQKQPEIGGSRTNPGTINALVVSYYKTAEWSGLNPATRQKRRSVIEKFRANHGDKRVALLTKERLEIMMAAIPNVYARRHWLTSIRGLLQSAIPAMRKDNPAKGIENTRLPKSKGHHTWTDDEIEQYRAHWPLGTQQRRVMEFALEAVSRRCEVVRLGPQHVRNGWIRIERAHGSADVEIPLTPELKAACDAMPKEHLTYVVNHLGKPRTASGIGGAFRQWATDAGLPKRCRLHGLKKGGMRRLAEAGNTAHELMGISGHRTLSEVQRYTAAADRKKLAGSGIRKKIEKENADECQPSGAKVPTHKVSD